MNLYNLREKKIKGDGRCQFSSIAYIQYGNHSPTTVARVKSEVLQHGRNHYATLYPKAAESESLLASQLGQSTTTYSYMNNYVNSALANPRHHGGEFELLAARLLYRKDFKVVSRTDGCLAGDADSFLLYSQESDNGAGHYDVLEKIPLPHPQPLSTQLPTNSSATASFTSATAGPPSIEGQH